MGVSPIRPFGKSGTDMLGASGLKDGLTDVLEGRGSRELGRGKNGHGHLEGHGSNDHLASIYERQKDQFAAVVPFIKQGLEQGERCLYVADDNTEEEVLEALREGGIDVGAAIESGALSIHTKGDTYLRTGEFETGAMLEFWQEALAKAKGEEGYSGVRAAAEMTWALDEAALDEAVLDEAREDQGVLDQLVEYEALLNDLYSGEDYVVLCQYSRERFPEEVLSEVIQSHPFVVYNGTVCGNHHYRPPEEFFEAERPPLDIGRTVEGLFSRARAQEILRERERFQHALYKITSDPGCSFKEKLNSLFDLGCEFFGMQFGGLSRIDQSADFFEVEIISGEHKHLIPGKEYPLSETYCQVTTDKGGTVSVSDPTGRGFEDKLCYEKFDVRAYLGTLVELDGALDRIFFFVSNEPREKSFTEVDRTFHHLMGQWVEQELRRRKREEDLKKLNETLEERVEERTRQVRELTAKVTLAEQRERDRIARLLHDGLQQRLYGSQLKLSSLQEEALGAGQEKLAGRIRKVEGEVEEITQALRQLSVGMSPPVLEGEGLTGALEWLQSHIKETYGLEVEFKAEREFHLQEEMRVLLFQIVRELLKNVDEHAGVGQATVHLREEEGNLVIEVSDEGQGFDPDKLESLGPEEGFGLTAARERIRLVEGDLSIESSPGEGTRVTIRVPMNRISE